MTATIAFTSLRGRREWFDPYKAELWLVGSGRSQDSLWRVAGRRWIRARKTDRDTNECAEVKDRDAAWLYIEYGRKPPVELAHLIAAENAERPWLEPGTKKWRSG